MLGYQEAKESSVINAAIEALKSRGFVFREDDVLIVGEKSYSTLVGSKSSHITFAGVNCEHEYQNSDFRIQAEYESEGRNILCCENYYFSKADAIETVTGIVNEYVDTIEQDINVTRFRRLWLKQQAA